MIRTTLLAAALALSANAQYFNYTLTALTAEDFSSTSHQIDFTVSVPGQFSEQGGSDPATCCIPWTGKASAAPTCYAPCQSGAHGYYTRVTPGSYKSAADFSIDVWQAYVYELGNHNNGTIHLSTKAKSSEYAYTCATSKTKNGERDCKLAGTVNATEFAYYGGADPPNPC